jgi:hypothetical protein
MVFYENAPYFQCLQYLNCLDSVLSIRLLDLQNNFYSYHYLLLSKFDLIFFQSLDIILSILKNERLLFIFHLDCCFDFNFINYFGYYF